MVIVNTFPHLANTIFHCRLSRRIQNKTKNKNCCVIRERKSVKTILIFSTRKNKPGGFKKALLPSGVIRPPLPSLTLRGKEP